MQTFIISHSITNFYFCHFTQIIWGPKNKPGEIVKQISEKGVNAALDEIKKTGGLLHDRYAKKLCHCLERK